MIPSTRNYPKVSHTYLCTVPYYILCFELILFWLWEILLEPVFASGFGKRGHAHSVHKHKMYNILNSPGMSSGLFRQPWSISQECCMQSQTPFGLKTSATSSTADRIQSQWAWRDQEVDASASWPSRGDSMQITPSSALGLQPLPQASLTLGNIHSISLAKLHLVLCANP